MPANNASSKHYPLSIPHFFCDKQKYLLEAIEQNQIAVGPHVQLLEERIRDFLNAKYSIAVNSGTAALELAIMCSKINAGEYILMPSFTFSASANAAISCGCLPFFYDIRLEDLCADVDQIQDFLASDCEARGGKIFHKRLGHQIGGIMAVHMYGNACEIEKLRTISARFGLELIEDGTEALGATYKSEFIGSNSSYFALSFNGNKIITAAGGGMLLTNNSEIAKKARELANQGKSTNNIEEINQAGRNLRMPNLNAAIACDQVFHLDKYLKKKQLINERYKFNLSRNSSVAVVGCVPGSISSNWLSIIRLQRYFDNMDVPSLIRQLGTNNIEARRVWKPLHLMKAYEIFPRLDVANSLLSYSTDLCLPSSVGLSTEDIDYVCKKLSVALASVSE